MSLTPLQEALWANDIQRLCLLESGGDIGAGLAAAEYILSTQPVPEDFALSTDAQGHEHRGKGLHGGEFTNKAGGGTQSNPVRESEGGTQGGPAEVWTWSDKLPDHNSWKQLEAEEGYFYHATNADNASDIQSSHMRPHRPWHGTDQRTWPDGSAARRIYLSDRPAIAWQFAPEEGKPALLRVRKNKHIKPERGTSDFYIEDKKVPPHLVEILTVDGWKALKSRTGSRDAAGKGPHGGEFTNKAKSGAPARPAIPPQVPTPAAQAPAAPSQPAQNEAQLTSSPPPSPQQVARKITTSGSGLVNIGGKLKSVSNIADDIDKKIGELEAAGKDEMDPEYASLFFMHKVAYQDQHTKSAERKNFHASYSVKDDGTVVAAGSMKRVGDGVAKIKDVGSVEKGAGKEIIQDLINRATTQWKVNEVTLDAAPVQGQDQLVKFYERMGFIVTGPDTSGDGIPMKLTIGQRRAAMALWATEVTRDCLLEAGGDIGAGLGIGRTYAEVVLAHDIHNPRAQTILDRALSVIKGISAAAKRDLAAALDRPDSGTKILEFIDKYRAQLAQALSAAQIAALLEGAREVAAKVPPVAEFSGAAAIPPTLDPSEAAALVDRLADMEPGPRAEVIYDLPVDQQEYVQQAVFLKEAQPGPSQDLLGGTQTADVQDLTGDVHFPTIEEAARLLSEKNVMTRQQFDALSAAARAKSFAVAGVDAEEVLTKIRDVLAENVSRGADHEAFKQEAVAAVGEGTFMSPAHMEAVFRTNVQSAFSDGQESVLNHPVVRSGFPYRSYDAIHDERVRENHLALETAGIGGTNIYRADDPVFQMFRPPWDYNDRCTSTPITVRQAAEAGVQEAVEWLRTGVEPSSPAYVPAPPFAPPPGFQRAVSAAPLSVRLSVHPLTSFGRVDKWGPCANAQYTAVQALDVCLYPRDRSNRFLDKHAVAEAARDPACETELREELPEDQRPNLDVAVAHLRSGGIIHHPREPAGLAVDINGAVVDPRWARYDEAKSRREAWEERESARQQRRTAVNKFTDSLRAGKAAAKLARAVSALPGGGVGTAETRAAVTSAVEDYTESLEETESSLTKAGATGVELRALARARYRTQSKLKLRLEDYVVHLKRASRRDSTEDEASALQDELAALRRAVLDACDEVEATYEDTAEAIHARVDAESGDDPEVEVPEEPSEPTSEAPAFSVGDDSGPDRGGDQEEERQQLIAEILVLLFGNKAEEVAHRLIAESGTDAAMALSVALATGPPIVKRRYGKKPGPGWTSGGTSSRGTPIWLWGARGSTPAPSDAPTRPRLRAPAPPTAPAGPGPPAQPPTATTPAVPPPPPPPLPAPAGPAAQAPPLRRGGQLARAQSIAAHNAAMAKIVAGQQLTAADKANLARKLTNMPVGNLRALHAALGGTGMLRNAKAAVAAVRVILTGGSQPQTPTPTPSPTTRTVQSNAPTKKVDPNVPAETNWETGKAQPGTLNGVDFAPAPPKFWEKVRDVDIGEPLPVSGKKVDRVGVMIQEPDGRIWIVQPTNEYGSRKYTMPGGTVEPSLTNQQNALKEIWEETGLQVEITGHLGDFEDSNNRKNGRLYIGRRVGGAPWDAKVEPHIVSRKTGKPAAESEVVSLVTPERAAQLLHRTDDLAQLAAVHPIALKTKPTRNVIDKIVNGVQSRAEHYEKKKKEAKEAAGDSVLHIVQEMRGFNEKPTVVNKTNFDALMAQGGHIEMLRGIAASPPSSLHGTSSLTPKQMAEQFRTGDHFPGNGMYGVGTYADATKGHSNVANQTYSSGGEVIRLAMPKSAKIIKHSELKRTVVGHPDKYKVPGLKSKADYWKGVHAALAGYDAIEVDSTYNGNAYYVILNRSILTVQDVAPQAGHVIR